MDLHVGVDRGGAPDGEGRVSVLGLESVQQSHFGSRFVFQHFNLQIDIEIGALMKRTVIPHLKPILNTSNLKIAMQTAMKFYKFSESSTVEANCNTETQIEMGDRTAEHFPGS